MRIEPVTAAVITPTNWHGVSDTQCQFVGERFRELVSWAEIGLKISARVSK